MAGQDPFFIVGAGRSGTTLLRLMLMGHPRLHIPPETWFLRPLVRQFPLTGALTQSQAERAIAAMVRHDRWPDLGMPAEALRARAAALADAGPLTLRTLVDLVYAHALAASGKPRLGDKTPHYFEIVPELAALYPGARFVHLLRDGHDVAMSWIDAGWQRYYQPGFEWPRAVRCLARDRAAFPGRVLDVRYEDLVRQPADTLRRICAFLGEAFDPAMLAWQDRGDEVAARDRHLHGRLMQPLAGNAPGLWRQRLSAGESFAMEACLHRELALARYPLRFTARFWRLPLGLLALLLRMAAPVLRRGVPYLQKRGLLPRTCYY